MDFKKTPKAKALDSKKRLKLKLWTPKFQLRIGIGTKKCSPVYPFYRHLWLTAKVNGYEVPKNIALLFFMDEPEMAFRGARIEVVYFPDDASGDMLQEWTFRGPLPKQIRDCVNHLEHFSTTYIQKHDDRYEASRWVSFPLAAIKETIVNAVYHRSYEGILEPTKVYIYPDRIEITSYPGPVPGLKKSTF